MTVKVTQADREAAADTFDCRVLSNGRYDNDSRVQAFARHRIAHQGQVPTPVVNNSGAQVKMVVWRLPGEPEDVFLNRVKEANAFNNRIAAKDHADEQY